MRKACLDEVYKLAKKDKRVVFVGSDLGAGVLARFKDEMPDRFFMEGISEQHIIGMSVGLAMNGFIPYVNTIATFITRRCFEQIVIDVCLHNLPVRLIGSGGGLVYAPLGPTHLAIDDIAIMKSIPNMTVIAVSDENEMRSFMKESISYKGPIYIRVAKGGDPIVTLVDEKFIIGKGIVVKNGSEVLVVTTGITKQIGLEAYEKLKQKKISVAVLHYPTIKPFDKKLLVARAKQTKAVIVIEEGIVTGGLGSQVAEVLLENKIYLPFKKIGIPDEFAHNYGSQNTLMSMYKITSENIIKSSIKMLTN
jgi:transketolase